MIDIQRHRGPDDQGARLFTLRGRRGIPWDPTTPPPAERLEGAVGFNRLSILDPSEAGHQPMCNDDGSVFIVFNGEVYNAFDLKPELERAGYRFRSRTDTEVILRSYEHFGMPETLGRLNGMFALCIVDLRRQVMLLARDRLGIKPLYWYERDGLFLFSSEVKSFLAHPEFRARVDDTRLDEYLAFRYCSGDGFLLADVRQLEPGHWMQLSPAGRALHRYWEVPDSPGGDADPGEVLERLETEIARSVRMRLLSDVKVGCQLSGGIDSSLVNLFATHDGGTEMDAFSVIFNDPQLSEEPWIDIAATKTGVRAHKFLLEADYVLDHLERTTWHMDEPLSHPNSIGIYRLAHHARETVTVLLSGEGADELFGGYYRFYYATLRPMLRRWLPLAGALPAVGSWLHRKFGPRSLDDTTWFILQSGGLSPERLSAARPTSRYERVLEQRRSAFPAGDQDFVSRCMKYDLQTYMVGLLIRQDKMTMAHSMENRVPFLDHRMVELVRGFPRRFLVGGGLGFGDPRTHNTKICLRRVASRHFDRRFVYRGKVGFALPMQAYLADPRFVTWMEDELLPGMRERGLVDAPTVESWWRGVLQGRGELADAAWAGIALEIWARQFVDGKRPTLEPPRAPR